MTLDSLWDFGYSPVLTAALRKNYFGMNLLHSLWDLETKNITIQCYDLDPKDNLFLEYFLLD